MKLKHCLLLFVMLALTACSNFEADKEREKSSAYNEGLETTLGKLFSSKIKKQDSDSSGFIILDSGREAFLKRLAIIKLAEQAIDLQYYIWNSDQSGRVLAQQLLLAADKGIHIRLLLDDFNIADRDTVFLMMDAHPNIEIRLYNPNSSRQGFVKVLSLLGNFGRLNQRMHNKSIVVDGSVAVVGGRNIGDEYFDLHDEMNFRDRDVLAIGNIVEKVANSFDAYWNNDRAFSVTKVEQTIPSLAEVTAFRKKLNKASSKDTANISKSYQLNLLFVEKPYQWLAKFSWAKAELVFDQPLSFNDEESGQIKRVATKLANLTQKTNKELIIESAYLIPGDAGIKLMADLTSKGITVSALTNSLASNDLTTNHSGYTRRRKEIVSNLVNLYELRPDAKSCQHLVESIHRCDRDTVFGLHSKSMVFDREIAFVGSFNVNQRSVYLNSETALIIYSAELAEEIALDIEENFSGENSWKLELDKNRQINWLERSEGKVIFYTYEPETDFWRRLYSKLFAIFPVEKYL